jgi:hypothetical protein
MPLHVGPRSLVRWRDQRHQPARGLGIALKSALAAACSVGFLLLPGSAKAQTQGTLQVSATVLNIEPSRQALQAALDSIGAAGVPWRAPSLLATVTVDTVGPSTDHGAAERPRAVVSITFLRN